MADIARILTSVDFWFTGIFGGIVASIIGNLMTERLRRLSGQWLRPALFADAIALPLLAASPFSAFVGSWPMDFMMGAVVGSVYWLASVMPSTGLRLFAFLGPKLAIAAMSIALYRISGKFDWRGMVATYPIMAMFFVFPVMTWAALVSHRIKDDATPLTTPM